MARRGRPKKVIDREQFEKLCAIFCTELDIAGFFGVGLETLARWCRRTYKKNFEDIYPYLSAPGRVSVRRRQFDHMQNGKWEAAKWLGIQQCGQSEKVQTVNKTDIDAKVQTIDRNAIKKANEELESEC